MPLLTKSIDIILYFVVCAMITLNRCSGKRICEYVVEGLNAVNNNNNIIIICLLDRADKTQQ